MLNRTRCLSLAAALALPAVALVGCASHGTASSSARQGIFAVVDGQEVPAPGVRMGNHATVERVIRLAQNESEVMDHLTYLCETFGARLTGSTACADSAAWARDRFEAWGLANARLEQWGSLDARFDRLRSVGDIVSRPQARGRDAEDDQAAEPEWQVERSIEFTTLSWTRGTDGPVTGPVVRMPDSLDDAEAAAESLRGAWVLLPAVYETRRGVRGIGYSLRQRNDLRHDIRTGAYDPFSAPAEETWAGSVDHEQTPLEILFKPRRDESGNIVGGRIIMPTFQEGDVTDVVYENGTLRMTWPNSVEQSAITLTIDGETMTGTAGEAAREIRLERTVAPDERGLTRDHDQILARVLDAEPAGFISASSDDRVWTTRPNNWRDIDPSQIPHDVEINVRRSDYDHINSRLADGQEVFARFDLEHRIDAGPVPVHNVIAEIPGVTHPDEIVIVSAHLDSWDGPGSQGTVDNATGVAVVMEAARLLMAAGARPDRTIKFILWTGEEQGLLGSEAYVAALDDDQRRRISAVFVDDGGTNYEGGLPAADFMVDYLAAATAPINGRFYSETDGQHLNVNIRPTGDRIRTHGGSDHAPFNNVGIPGFFWDEVGRADYRYAWHTQNDRVDQAIPEYLVQSSACMAVTAYNIASAPGLLPREAEVGPEVARQGEEISAPAGRIAEQVAIGR